MRRTEQVQGLRLMKFAEVYGRTHRGGLSQAEAAEVLGVSERTFRRWHFRSPPAATAAIIYVKSDHINYHMNLGCGRVPLVAGSGLRGSVGTKLELAA